MAAPLLKVLNVGTLAMSVFDFAAAGDVLPMHVHDEATAHVTLVNAARFGFAPAGAL